MITYQARNISILFGRKSSKIVPRNLKGKSKSAQEWLTRQLNDPYVEKAKIANYRCRSAFKLLEIDDKYKLLQPGHLVIDCGAAPGGWTQVACTRTNANQNDPKKPEGTVFSIDLLHIHPIEGATIFGGRDFQSPEAQKLLCNGMGNRLANLIMSDMAPNATGIKSLDQENITNLCYSVLQFAIKMSRSGGNLLMKLWDNGNVQKLETDILRFYEKVKRIKPHASRADSTEMFLLGRNYKGNNTPPTKS